MSRWLSTLRSIQILMSAHKMVAKTHAAKTRGCFFGVLGCCWSGFDLGGLLGALRLLEVS